MKTDLIPTVTRRQGILTFAMKKRPTSGDVTHIRTLHHDVDVNASDFERMMVLVVLNKFLPSINNLTYLKYYCLYVVMQTVNYCIKPLCTVCIVVFMVVVEVYSEAHLMFSVIVFFIQCLL